MKVQTKSLDELLFSLRQYFQTNGISSNDDHDKSPLRSEIFSIEQMTQHAHIVAEAHSINFDDQRELLLKRLAENEDILNHVTGLLQDAIRQKSPIAPAGEWLLDNYYLIEEQIQLGKRYLPKGYSKGLPKVSSGFPRVYEIAIEIISHSDGHLDIHTLSSFIRSYQEVKELTLGELWAVPIMLRLALLENLRRVAARIALDRIDAVLAHQWADKIIRTSEDDPKSLILVLADMARSNPPMGSTFVAEFYRKLQWRGSSLALPISWIEQQLSENNLTINGMVLSENQKQAADQVSITNSITSLRLIAKLDWREFVETMSLVEETLRKDIDGVYGRMDFHSRDRYRHSVERIAKKSKTSESKVAQTAIDLAKASAHQDGSDKRKAHVGYYLIDRGCVLTEKKVLKNPGIRDQLSMAAGETFGHKAYALALTLITLIASIILIRQADLSEYKIGTVIAFALVAILCTSHLASALVNWLSTLLAHPKPMPKLDYSQGVPPEARTMIVVPTIISGHEQAERLVDDLEVRFLANRDPNLLFALATDFRDAPTETLPSDDDLIQLVSAKINELNTKYPNTNHTSFFLFHRARKWNEKQKAWMGHERKRGKLEEINQLLRGEGSDKFSVIIGTREILSTVQYVITLDTDTQLPREAAWKLIGMMQHPLNYPRFDQRKKIITEGYGIIQPRIATSFHGATRSAFSALHEYDSGIDPYTRMTSDVYQDVFAEGSFIGKGIYHVDTFEKVLHSRFPDNRILSHDLLEGSYARCGFASDIQFYEHYPSTYQLDISRRHRWIRGDWQIGNWFLPFVPGYKGISKNPINTLSRWKIVDNLRRSLVPIALTILLVLGWTWLSDPVFWTAVVVTILFGPTVLIALWNYFQKPKEIPLGKHLRNVSGETSRSFILILLEASCLPYEAFISIDAIFTTLWRILISRRNQLEWNPSGLQPHRSESVGERYRRMWINPVLFIGLFIYLAQNSPMVLAAAAPFLIAWLIAPYIVWKISQPSAVQKSSLTEERKLYLRELSRKTWSFFETFVGPADNWLPPDNLQEFPIPVVAHRTSPTNIGLSLLANLAARDFGYVTTTQLLERTTNTFQTIRKLERFSGHLYNWYDTQTLRTLSPRYISTVDSGNFAGHLLTLRQALLAIPNEKIIDNKFRDGITDTARLIMNTLPDSDRTIFVDFIQHVASLDKFPVESLVQVKNYLEDITDSFNLVTARLNKKLSLEAAGWIEALRNQLVIFQKETMLFEPWMTLQTSLSPGIDIDLPDMPTLAELSIVNKTLMARYGDNEDYREWILTHEHILNDISKYANERIEEVELLAEFCAELADIEFNFLYDKSQHLLTIGYTVDNHHRDASFYDLLASEARLASFVAIAQGKLPQENWFALGRRLTTAGSTSTLLSWSGSMFEYLMPLLVMPSYANTLLDETYHGSVRKQIEYGEQHRIPWGVSESCYNVVDAHLTYQYKAFGVPQLGFKRGLDKDIVIAPYATVMALMIDPAKAVANLERMRNLGYEGKFGFYEAIDFTPVRLPRSKSPVLIQTFMAHHQGMGLLALDFVLNDQPMQRRFCADPQFQTALLLLQERVPKTTGLYQGSLNTEEVVHATTEGELRIITKHNTLVPEIQLLSNGKYHVMVSNTGGGYSRWKELALTRWREDPTRDHWGSFCYIRNLTTKEFWSTTYQPTLKETEHYEAIFSQGRAEFKRRDHDIDSQTEIVVSPEDDIEIRRTRLTNLSDAKQKIEITSYGEVVIALPVSDAAHPAFSNLFVQTEILDNQHAILCTRRPRSADEHPPWMFHLMKLNEAHVDEVSYETDRYKFIGRGKNMAHPRVMDTHEPLSGSQGSVLDPIVSIQYRITLMPGESVTVDSIIGIASTRAATQGLIDKYQDRHLRDRAFDLSWTHSQVVLRQINSTESQAQLYTQLAASVIYANAGLRASSDVLLKNHKGQSALWSYSISGDLPIVLLLVSNTTHIDLVKQLILARAYWQLKGLNADVVILNEDSSGYRQELQEQIQQLLSVNNGLATGERQGGIYVRSVDQIPTEDYILFQTVARAIISDSRGSLHDQLNRPTRRKKINTLVPERKRLPIQHQRLSAPTDLLFNNGHGGFRKDGKEYVVYIDNGNLTPLPWVNVLANKHFGTIITESGPSYTWAENAHEFRLTPWSNDPVTDASGEAIYIRDEESGVFWSPMPWPVQTRAPYIVRHGFGYTTFEHHEHGIFTEVTIFVDIEQSVKFTSLKMRNESGRRRKLSVTNYSEWVLGARRPQTSMYVVIEQDINSGALVARNSYNTEFPNRTGFIHTDERAFSFTCDRKEFIGRNGSLQNPLGMKRQSLSGKSGAGLDPCTAIQIPFDLDLIQEKEIIFRMGSGKDIHETRAMIQRFKGKENTALSRQRVTSFWNDTLNSIQIETPDTALNTLANGWLLYQVLSCRFWGRSGFYQSGGAYGFRDQLQDVLALIHADPSITREHILLSASRQFTEGDVQHWWHPPSNRGVRTLCSDDFVWLPYVTSRYIEITGDTSILNEIVPFIDGRPLHVHEESYYDMPVVSPRRTSLYDHCKLAIQRALRFGVHGLPLIGSGDWNDGMNMVGIEGRGESTWLGFFVYDVLQRFKSVARVQKDAQFEIECEEQSQQLKMNLNNYGWDGNWYLRAYFDNGMILGSAANDECRIDSISQSWSVISGAGDDERSPGAMLEAEKYLVNNEKALIQLLDPPFDKSVMNPGYIKGYVPGVRENGGQYTHAAIWMVMAFAKLGDQQRTWRLLDMINPINHGNTKELIDTYKVEPYVMAADVYAVSPHNGRGGWTWYTGSAGWMYQLIIESFMGLRREGNSLHIESCIPAEWKSVKVKYRYLKTVYHISIIPSPDETVVAIDGSVIEGDRIPLNDDGKEHEVTVHYKLKRSEVVTQNG
jgi:cyclic beta-1,2-glucan synthetase